MFDRRFSSSPAGWELGYSGICESNIRLYSRRWWDSGVLFPELCTPGAHSHSSHARNDGIACCQRAAEERQRRCGRSRYCRCWCCLAWAQPKCWGARRQTAGFLGCGAGDGTSTARPARLWWPGGGSHNRRKPTRTPLTASHRCLGVL